MKSVQITVTNLPKYINNFSIFGDCLCYTEKCWVTGNLFSRTEAVSHLFKKNQVKLDTNNKFEIESTLSEDGKSSNVDITMYYEF